MDLGPYTTFIASSYLAAALVVALLIAWIMVDHRTQKARLRALEESGVNRRSGRAATDMS
ncbi:MULTISPECIES: heme exporter protein CcmD [unclassified Bradyrhizobium]|uniref:heme exporter protein CcmD n=1 Tax=unclassified Bradyrhizobium TaxID=2631580 RepID=UPI0028E44CC6|nr:MULTISPECIES: heme exporter protein CcmD [unclassified Bradyrhizobium]